MGGTRVARACAGSGFDGVDGFAAGAHVLWPIPSPPVTAAAVVCCSRCVLNGDAMKWSALERALLMLLLEERRRYPTAGADDRERSAPR